MTRTERLIGTTLALALVLEVVAGAPLVIPTKPGRQESNDTLEFIETFWEDSVMPSLLEYLRIPNQSPAYDPEWETNGYMDEAIEEYRTWALDQDIHGLTLDVVREPGKPPLLFGVVEGSTPASETVLLYSHLDKQPPLTEEWSEGKGPYDPVIEDGKLYARGSCDDGYAWYTYFTIIKGMQEFGIPHPRFVIMSESEEESGSADLPYYLSLLEEDIGTPKLVVVLDSGAGNYEQLFMTTSLRGIVAGELRVDVLKEGLHSGSAGGLVASSFRKLRQAMDLIEDSTTGEVLVEEFYAQIPDERLEQADLYARSLGDDVYNSIPFADGVGPVTTDPLELVLNRSWRPALSTVAADGFPEYDNAGNVIRPFTTVKLSIRIPPLVDAEAAADALEKVLEQNQPHDAAIDYIQGMNDDGWNADSFPEYLSLAVSNSSLKYYGEEALYYGEGGSIPFMKLLSDNYGADMVITGVVGPNANAHGPDEFLELGYTKKLAACVFDMIEAFAVQE